MYSPALWARENRPWAAWSRSQLQRSFVDSDDLIVERAGKSIAQLFAEVGEDRFRSLERSVCSDLAAQNGLVIATGGGALLDADSRSALGKSGLLICLLASPESIRTRLAHESGRPLFNGAWESLYQRRLAIYQTIPHQLPTDGKAAQEVAQEVVSLWHVFR